MDGNCEQAKELERGLLRESVHNEKNTLYAAVCTRCGVAGLTDEMISEIRLFIKGQFCKCSNFGDARLAEIVDINAE